MQRVTKVRVLQNIQIHQKMFGHGNQYAGFTCAKLCVVLCCSHEVLRFQYCHWYSIKSASDYVFGSYSRNVCAYILCSVCTWRPFATVLFIGRVPTLLQHHKAQSSYTYISDPLKAFHPLSFRSFKELYSNV